MARARDFSYRDDAAVPDFDDGRPIIVFDGHCVFCSAWVRFVLNQDRRDRYRFIAAQTPLGDALYRHYGLETRDYETNMLLENGRAYLKSDATLRVLAGLALPWSLAGVARIVPRGWRDNLYGFIARHPPRYRRSPRKLLCANAAGAGAVPVVALSYRRCREAPHPAPSGRPRRRQR